MTKTRTYPIITCKFSGPNAKWLAAEFLRVNRGA